MRLVTQIDGDLPLDMEMTIRAGRLAALGAVTGVGATIKDNWRTQIASAGLGRRLGNTVRMEAYPRQGSLNAAALVWSKAKKIVGAFETGVEIRAKNARFLAIPLPAAGKSTRNGRITPGEWERRRGRKLVFIQRRRGGALLVDNGTVIRGPSTFGRGGVARGFKNRSVPIFVLVPRVRLEKRLGLITAADRLANSMGARLVAGWRD
ncbi:DUF6441 family protein [Novosphingobium sp.]|uniref:DUF6441 family protein n=1 Tax=Novosphingobium sp. TaxID=1874826 RepID=UPI00261D4A0A|nr:DUF6441 family protein [Novosphingobium sp.]